MAEGQPNSRLETFCDGVFAIALTLLIIEVRLPATERITSTAAFWRALAHIAPSVLAFLLSFTVILIAWVNHHAAMRLINKSSSRPSRDTSGPRTTTRLYSARRTSIGFTDAARRAGM